MSEEKKSKPLPKFFLSQSETPIESNGPGVCFYVSNPEAFDLVLLVDLSRLYITSGGHFDGIVKVHHRDYQPIKLEGYELRSNVNYFQKSMGFILVPESMNEMGDYLTYYKKQLNLEDE
jgi:hypothetical protein